MAYQHAFLAGILVFFILPGAAVVAFLLTPFARRRRLLPWLLIPVVYVLVALISLTFAVNLGYLEG